MLYRQSYVWESEDWPHWVYDAKALWPLVTKIHRAQGHLFGRLEDCGMDVKSQAMLHSLTSDVLKTSEIEGEMLNPHSVRSSIALRLGLDVGGSSLVDRNVDGVVDMTLDATQHYDLPLTKARLFGWHRAMFPTGISGLSVIRSGAWRDDIGGPMQIVSGGYGVEKVHYEAPPAEHLEQEIASYLDWFNHDKTDDPVIKAGIAHIWFEMIHPFDDGNGRIGRAIADMALAKADMSPHRYYSLSSQIHLERKEYYRALEKAGKGGLDITLWLEWFLACLYRSIESAQNTLNTVLEKSRFWKKISHVTLSERQTTLINSLLDGTFFGHLTTSKWAKIAKCSQDTAYRDMLYLTEKGILMKSPDSGRSTHYQLLK
jgi:Fic family protein